MVYRRLDMSALFNTGSWSIMSLIEYLEQLEERRRSRFLLSQLDDTQLRDIGLSRADAEREAHKLPWVA
jgi:uncharacterized protein YjiS (DUF1127 family)